MVRYILLNITQPFINLTRNPSKKVRIPEKLDIPEKSRFTKISGISSVNCTLKIMKSKARVKFLKKSKSVLMDMLKSKATPLKMEICPGNSILPWPQSFKKIHDTSTFPTTSWTTHVKTSQMTWRNSSRPTKVLLKKQWMDFLWSLWNANKMDKW